MIGVQGNAAPPTDGHGADRSQIIRQHGQRTQLGLFQLKEVLGFLVRQRSTVPVRLSLQ